MRFWLLSLSVLLGVLLQATWLPALNLPGQVIPDLVLIMVVNYALLRGSDEGLIFGLCAGFFVDILAGGLIGVQVATKTLAGYTVGLLEKTIFKDNLLLPALAVFVATISLETLHFIMYMAFKVNNNFIDVMLNMIFPLALYNAFFAPFIYYLFLKLERYLIERVH